VWPPYEPGGGIRECLDREFTPPLERGEIQDQATCLGSF
jgi:hypothetical protein